MTGRFTYISCFVTVTCFAGGAQLLLNSEAVPVAVSCAASLLFPLLIHAIVARWSLVKANAAYAALAATGSTAFAAWIPHIPTNEGGHEIASFLGFYTFGAWWLGLSWILVAQWIGESRGHGEARSQPT